MATRKALVVGANGLPQQLQSSDTLEGAGGTVTISAVVIDFGSTPVPSKTFDVAVSGATSSSKVLASVSLDMPSGVDADELEMDPLSIAAHGIGTDLVRIQATSFAGPVTGQRRINLTLG